MLIKIHHRYYINIRKLYLFILLLIIPAISNSTNYSPTIKSVWYKQTSSSPLFNNNEQGIKFNWKNVTGINGQTIVIYGASKLPGIYGERYGGRIPGAIIALAISNKTNLVYTGKPERLNSAPLLIQSQQNSNNSPTSSKLHQISNYFNFDLVKQLSLPSSSSRYTVVLWVDDYISTAQNFLVRENDSPQESTPLTKINLVNTHYSYKNKITSKNQLLKLFANQKLKRLNVMINTKKTQRKLLNLFQLCGQSRKIHWYQSILPTKKPKPLLNISFDLKELKRCSADESTYLLIQTGTFISNPIKL